MTNHPLTDDLCYQLRWMFLPDPGQRENMRNAADWQLEQVIKWLDENLSNYTSAPLSDSPGDLEPLFMLRGDLRQAMRPKTQEDN